MNTIHAYVESIFDKLPQTKEMLQLKSEMLMNMEDKYSHLITEGISEHAAIGQVLSEFGNIDEIIEAYNLDTEEDTEAYDSTVIVLSKDEAERYFFHRQKYALAIAIGVFLCIISVSIMFLAMVTGSLLFPSLSEDSTTLVGVVLMLVTIAFGVGIFIIFGIQESNYPFDKKVLELDYATHAMIEEQYLSFKPKMSYAIAAGVVSCILGPIFLLLSFAFLNDNSLIGIVFLLGFIAVGVFLFVYYGIQNDTFEKLLTIGSHTKAHVVSNTITERLGAIIFPIATLIYLFQGFVNNAWGTAWIIFPIVGISFAVLAAIIEGVTSLTHKK